MITFPEIGEDWLAASPAVLGFDEARLSEAVGFAETSETAWPRDLASPGGLPGMTAIEPPPWNAIIGPLKARGGPNGMILRDGQVAASWGDTKRADMTFSIAKSYLAILTGLALGDGLLESIDEPLSARLEDPLFHSAQNKPVTWRHLLTQTSEWQGTLWDKPDQVDHYRSLGSDGDNSRKGQLRPLQTPGTYWEYNDVRVNLLALALLMVFRQPLPEVLKERIMDPIGASSDWRWHAYHNAVYEIDGQAMPSVPGGTHWGGGMQISSQDHARFALLIHNQGRWKDQQLVPADWCQAIRQACPLHQGYGLLWWLNKGKAEWPSGPESSYAAIGAGTNIIWIAPEQDLILVARWIDKDAVDGLISRIMAAFS